MRKKFYLIINMIVIIISFNFIFAQNNAENELLSEKTFSGLKFRSIGPAFMSGRIADIAIHPMNKSIWYVAVGSGGVWKTTNAGTTWQSIFDGQTSYSIGCVTIDHQNPHVIWVGTGENVGGRHVGYGDGIYKSEDGGITWKNMGLKDSHHISKIIIHPENSDVLWVAAQGPLWSKGGERGLYKSIDGGESWKKVLGDEEWVGVTDVVIDPSNSKLLYAATWQRHRNVAAYMGGGPGTGIYRSDDGGDSWKKSTKGLPKSNMGKIGLAISPQKPDIIYAAIELNRRNGGVFKSTNRGASWTKQSDAVSGATGPHYYQELYASPHKFDRIYLADVRIQISDDGGKTFTRLKENLKHSDNHSITFRNDDPNYLLVGTDGGIYESFDNAENWRFIANLPVTQYYKVAVDDAEPFYNIYGGTQDNNTHGGPSRTDNLHGIRNSDWFITLGGDGHQPATEPGNPNIVYSESQQGNLYRIDRTSGEVIAIRPQSGVNEDFNRFNWDSPILISPHSPTRLYFGSQRVWRSDNRGDSWKAISGDLTRNQERITLPIMGSTQSWDAPWDVSAMSTYNTITSLAESPIKEDLIYAGTDDGLIQITEDGGKNWTAIEVGSLPEVPKTAFVNDIKADLFDANTVYIALDNHKFGDLNPYLLKSLDRGESWQSIKGNLPNRTLVWRIVQDYIKPNLLFAATEFGIYFTIDGGEKWVKFSGGLPTISFRDLAIQKRENDLIGASFGRSFYVLDDYSVLRDISEEQLKNEAVLFSTRKAWWYIERPVLSFGKGSAQGASYFTAPNPPFGAVFTYYLADGYKTKKVIRQEKESELIKKKKAVSFPGWDEVESERRQDEPIIWLTIKNEKGDVIRKITGPTQKGFHRVAWDLTYPSTYVLNEDRKIPENEPSGVMAAPGKYYVTLSKQIDGEITNLSKPMMFEVEQLRKGALKGSDPETVVEFWRQIAEVRKNVSGASLELSKALKKVKVLKTALLRSNEIPGRLENELHQITQELFNLDEELMGNGSKREIGEDRKTTISNRLSFAAGNSNSTYGPTPAHTQSLEIAKTQFADFKSRLELLINIRIPKFEQSILDAGAPLIK
jgi:photosystem II stability/assembly factor-like uncharacterized protein